MVDVAHQISAVSRRVGSRVLDAGEARVITISQTYDVEADDLWDACTNPERIPRWFLPVSGELRLGGHYQLEGNAYGTVERCDPPKSFAATWEYDGGVSWIEVRVAPETATRTRLEIDHIAPVDEHWEKFGPGAAGVGWDMIVMGLALHLSGAPARNPNEVATWGATDEGHDFVKRSSDLWHEANVASGEDEATARAAANLTTAFYTEMP